MDAGTIIVVWLACGIIGALIGPSHGYAPITAFAIAAVFGIFGLAFIVLVKGSNETPDEIRARQYYEQWNGAPAGAAHPQQPTQALPAPPSYYPPPAPPAPAGHNPARVGAVVVGGLVVLALIWYVAFRSGGPVSPLVGGIDNGGWEKNWNQTTCSDFQTKMTDNERRAFATWALNFERRQTLASAPDADSAMVSRFQSAVSTTCSGSYTGPTYPIVGAGVLAYLGDSSYEPTYR